MFLWVASTPPHCLHRTKHKKSLKRKSLHLLKAKNRGSITAAYGSLQYKSNLSNQIKSNQMFLGSRYISIYMTLQFVWFNKKGTFLPSHVTTDNYFICSLSTLCLCNIELFFSYKILILFSNKECSFTSLMRVTKILRNKLFSLFNRKWHKNAVNVLYSSFQ